MEDDSPQQEEEEAGGGWLMTFADLMSLLMSFFVLLLQKWLRLELAVAVLSIRPRATSVALTA